MDRTGIGDQIFRTIIAWRANHQPPVIERYAAAEKVLKLERRNRNIGAAGVSAPNDRRQRRACKRRVGKADQIDRTGKRCILRIAAVAISADGQYIAIEGERAAQNFVCGRCGERQVIAGSDRSHQRTTCKSGIGKGEQIDRARSIGRVARTVFEERADRQPGAVERDRTSQRIARLGKRRRVEVRAPGISAADGADQAWRHRCQIEQIYSTGFLCAVAATVIADRANGQPVAVERHRPAELVGILQGETQIAYTAIILTDYAELRGGLECVACKPEEIYRACAIGIIVETPVAKGADSQLETLQRNRAAELCPRAQFADRQVLAAGVTAADDAFQDREFEIVGDEGEQIDRACVREAVAEPVIARRADC